MRILIVGDDLSASSDVRSILEKASVVVDYAGTGEQAIELMRLYNCDAVVLHMALSGINGLEIIQRMRAAKVTQPILIVATNTRNEVMVRALGLGADDFLLKPYDRDELMARLKAVIRRTRSSGRANLQVGPLKIDVTAHEAWANGERLKLTGKEYAILELLVLRKGSTLSKESILEHLYGGIDVPEIKIIDVFVCKLRKKLGQHGAGDMIGTVWGRGYGLQQPGATKSGNGNLVSEPAAEAA